MLTAIGTIPGKIFKSDKTCLSLFKINNICDQTQLGIINSRLQSFMHILGIIMVKLYIQFRINYLRDRKALSCQDTCIESLLALSGGCVDRLGLHYSNEGFYEISIIHKVGTFILTNLSS